MIFPVSYKPSQNLYEEVSDLNGICIPFMYYDYIINDINSNVQSNSIYDIIYERSLSLDKKHDFLHNIIDNSLESELNNVSDYLYASNILKALDEQLYFKLRQISKDDCNWLLDEDIDKCMLRIDNVIKSDFEKQEPPSY